MIPQLRGYQQDALDDLDGWFAVSGKLNPCLVLPTGSGKSHIVAALCKNELQKAPETMILMLTHAKELIEQNAAKMLEHAPDAPLGIYSASAGRKQLGNPITFAGIQSLRRKAREIGHIDIVIIDECHLVSHKGEGVYRMLLDDLKAINPRLRVIGLTATPYRLGHGLITDKPAIFDALIEPVTIESLVADGYLATLRSKATAAKLDVSGVHKRGGEYIDAELQDAVDTEANNESVVGEIIALAGDRKAWLLFCAGVAHAQHVAVVLRQKGISAECVTGDTPKAVRERLIADFRVGKIRALTNANVLTTGFDHPDIDLIAMLRPTMSPGLYVQMAGRGMRPKSHTDHCLVLDFAGVVAAHGPITAVQPPVKGSVSIGDTVPPTKVCTHCGEICPIAVVVCPACKKPFPEPASKKLKLKLHDDDIMGMDYKVSTVTAWVWHKHVSRASGKSMLACSYYVGAETPPILEYLVVTYTGYAGDKARQTLRAIASSSGAALPSGVYDDLELLAELMTSRNPPSSISYTRDGNFYRVLKRLWD